MIASFLRTSETGQIHTPTILQMEALECGAASLAMVMAYYGRWVPLEEMRVLCGVSRDGSKAVNLLKAARSLGMEASGKRIEPRELAGVAVPAILFVNMNHFVVFEGMTGDRFRINDPAVGRRYISAEEFDSMFTGVALLFKPAETFQPGGKPPSILPGLFAIARNALSPLILLLAVGLLLSILGMLLPGIQRVYVDRVLIEQIDNWVFPLALTLLLVATLVVFLTWLHGRLAALLAAKLSLVLSGRLVWRVLRMPVMFFSQRYAGTISSRVVLADQLVLTLTHGVSEFIIQGGLLLLLSLLMLQYSPLLTLISLGIALFNVLLFSYLRKAIGQASEKVAMQMVKMSGKAMQGVLMMETLKSTGSEDVFFSRWAGLQTLYINAQQDIARREALIQLLQTWLASLLTAAVLVIGGYLTMLGDLSIGILVAFTTVSILFNQQVAILVSLATTVQQTKGTMTQLDDTLRYPTAAEFEQDSTPADISQPTLTSLQRITGKVTLENLTFAYAPLDKPLIEDLSLSIAPGARVALVGGSGSGKSTVGKLVAGLYEPQQGQVCFDGVPLAQVPRNVLRNSLAVVDQNIVLFAGSVRENIALWDNTLPEEQLVQAAKDAMIHDDILSRQGGYDAPIEENGRNISGGQRQRLEIARALAMNPTLLVLDEATSALDTMNEKAIMDNLRRRGCACLIIAHRLSSIRDCDEIIVMQQGHIIERGRHEQLMDEGGAYRTLIET